MVTLTLILETETPSYETLGRGQALRKILSGQPNEMINAFLSLSYHDSDPPWTAHKLLFYSRHPEPAICSMALHCLFLISRLHGILKLPESLDAALANLERSEREVRHASEELLAEIIGAYLPDQADSLDEAYRRLKRESLLENLVGINQLFLCTENRERVKQIWRKVWAESDPIVRARTLVEVRSFITEPSGIKDANFLHEVLAAGHADPAPYVKAKAQELENWKSHYFR